MTSRLQELCFSFLNYNPESSKAFLEGLSRFSNLDVGESGAGRGEDGLCRTADQT